MALHAWRRNTEKQSEERSTKVKTLQGPISLHWWQEVAPLVDRCTDDTDGTGTNGNFFPKGFEFKKKRACELNLANSISQVILITAASIYGAYLQQFAMFYSYPACSVCSLMSALFVKLDFIWLRSP